MASVTGSRNPAPGLGVRQVLIAVAGLLFIADLFLIFLYAPTADPSLGTQLGRMVYFHPPIAMVGMLSMAVSAIASVVFLAKRNRKWDRIAWASAEIGAVLFTLAVVTGAIWAKPVWQTWWVWDANGTLTFMLWLVFIGYLIVRAYAPTLDQGARWAAIVAIFGAAATPFVYLAGDWWAGLHTERITGPGAAGSLEAEMARVFYFSLLTFVFLFGVLVAERAAQHENEEALEELREAVR